MLRNDSLVMSRFLGGFFDREGRPYYYMTDCQGNNIGVIDKDGNRFLFGDKERETAGALNLYDFTARHYSAVFPRFTSIDPECESFYHLNPYTYCAGNPVNIIDPTGCIIEGVSKKDAAMAIGDFRAMFPGEEFASFRNLKGAYINEKNS